MYPVPAPSISEASSHPGPSLHSPSRRCKTQSKIKQIGRPALSTFQQIQNPQGIEYRSRLFTQALAGPTPVSSAFPPLDEEIRLPTLEQRNATLNSHQMLFAT
jgi:hypothetical protein